MRRALALPVLALVLAACVHDGRDLRPAQPGQNQSILVTTTTSVKKGASLQPALTTAEPLGSDQAEGGDVAGDGDGGGTAASASATAATTTLPVPTKISLTLPWADNAAIDAAYTCKGAGSRPLVTWTNIPTGTKELALTVTDDDASGYIHWVVAGIPPTARSLPTTGLPAGSVESKNDHGSTGWYGPCPPAGATHHYRFTLYALAAPSGVTAGADPRTALAAVQHGVVGLDVVFGTVAG